MVKSCKQRGFTITELMLVIGVGTVMIAAAFYGYKQVSEENADRENAYATARFLGAIKAKWRGIGTYSTVDVPNVIAAGLVTKPFAFKPDGTVIWNPYQQPFYLFGSPAEFFALMTIPKSKCVVTVAALDGVAYKIWSGGAAIKDVGVPLSSWNGSCGADMGGNNMIMAYAR